MKALTKRLQLDKFNDVYILNKPLVFEHLFLGDQFYESLLHTSCVNCALVFARTKDSFVNQMLTLFPRLQDDSTLWIIYPIGTTKKELANLHQEFNWEFLGEYRLQPTRLINVNSNWNAIKLKKQIFNLYPYKKSS
ncbi:MAG: hypothetical protein ACPGU9_01290 [Flavobacteriaceae bacterium]